LVKQPFKNVTTEKRILLAWCAKNTKILDMSEKYITICLSEEERNLLRHYSQRENTSESDIVRAALNHYFATLSARKTCYDLAKELGILGVAQQLPPDLSTNKDHFYLG